MSEQPKTQSKPIYKSKTMWLNTAVLLLAVADTLTGALKPFLPAEAMSLIIAGVSAANIILRAATGQPVSVGKPKA